MELLVTVVPSSSQPWNYERQWSYLTVDNGTVSCTGIPQLRPQREYIPLSWYVKNVPTVRTCHLSPRVSAQQQQQLAVIAEQLLNQFEDSSIPQSARNQPNNWSVAFSSHLL